MTPFNRINGGQSSLGCCDDFYVRFWGVRGSIACADPDMMKYGGNTSCLEVCCGGRTFIFDAGTGLRYLGLELQKKGPIDIDLFLTHTHFDHICGLPFFGPFYARGNVCRIWSGHLGQRMTTKEALGEFMASPLFPVPLEVFVADVSCNDFTAGADLEPSPEVSIQTTLLNHPDGATGYRINYKGRSIAYVTDTEHEIGKPDERILKLIQGADVFIYDATHTDEEFVNEVGKGHSTWQEGARLAELADVKCYAVFHHDPGHNDSFMDQIATDLEKMRPGSVVAREGLILFPQTDTAPVQHIGSPLEEIAAKTL